MLNNATAINWLEKRNMCSLPSLMNVILFDFPVTVTGYNAVFRESIVEVPW